MKTTKEGESNWHLLDVNWREFAGDLDALVESVNVHPVEGPEKEDEAEQGTQILITALNDGWSAEKLQRIATAELSKLMDPFSDRTLFPIAVYYNKTRLKIPAFNHLLFEHAHASVTASLSLEANNQPAHSGAGQLLARKETEDVCH